MTTTATTRRLFTRLTSALLLTCVCTLPALAQDPVVSAADPPSAEQETLDLEVTISGDNFAKDAEVDFFVTGTENPGGIVVKGKPKVLGPKKLKVKIDVEADAVIDGFDIQVMSRGRTGKGIELFRVTEKVHPTQDETPPNAVYDLGIGVPELTPEGDYQVPLTWTSPADPPLMGAATEYWVKAKAGSSLTLEDWQDERLPTNYLGPDYPPPAESPGAPGSTESATLRFLAPETTYTVSLRSVDASENWSGLSNTVTFVTGPPPPSDWTAETIDTCPAESCYSNFQLPYLHLAYAPDGSPAVFYTKIPAGGLSIGNANGTGWVARRTITGWSHILVDFPIGNQPTFGLDPDGVPLILNAERAIQQTLNLHRWDGQAWVAEEIASGKLPLGYRGLATYTAGDTKRLALGYRPDSKGKVRLALWDGESWEEHDITSTFKAGSVQVAFDDLGRAAILYEGDANGDRAQDTVHFALWNGTSWEAETIETCPDLDTQRIGNEFSLQWNPARGEFWVSFVLHGLGYAPSRTRICSRDQTGAWQCDDLPDPEAFYPTVAFDDYGTAYVAVTTQDFIATTNGGIMKRLWSRDTLDPDSTWTSEIVDWTTDLDQALRFDPVSGEIGVFHYAESRPLSPFRLLRKPLP